MSKTSLTRRSFVKVSALAGAAAAVGASMAGCMQDAAPEEGLAGTQINHTRNFCTGC